MLDGDGLRDGAALIQRKNKVAPKVKIENIEQLRRQAGIDDVELREAIDRLRVGDHVRVTFLIEANPRRSETLLVCITNVRDAGFRGKLVTSATARAAGSLQAGTLISFGRSQIHSVSVV